ncbi:protein SUPPRESSOR OF npr1-1, CONSTITUTIVE 1-like [Dorcoceras hygrometricum]|uniref:Protein SUPPRESSOR OF npr1-1, CONSTITUTIVE 1-like n=1 Tax=Dorcoceras hygrometricum TaxID=472368 RepID=A0A2Z7BQL1_9LAMI|nr:protein SUPPRESSOR OF npr1-1, CONSTITUTIVE 1-like [Dorcoceras hygrometricum]
MPPPPPPRVAGIRSGRFDEENPFVQNLSVLLVQADKGVSVLVVDRIGDFYHSLPRRADVIVTTVGARHKCQQGSGFEPPMYDDICIVVFRIDRLPAIYSMFFRCLAGGRIRIPNKKCFVPSSLTQIQSLIKRYT